ncbi:MAG: hypothetical protein PVH41_04020 [Anaerolineae bacterium]|jgi:hypothetical protein
MCTTALKVSAFLTGLVMTGEALALAIGMHVLSSEGNPWVALKNDAFLVLDVIAGLVLVGAAVSGRRLQTSGWVYAVWFISLVAHGYREWEYLVRADNAFCANGPLFAVNSVKLIGLLVAGAGAVAMRMVSGS